MQRETVDGEDVRGDGGGCWLRRGKHTHRNTRVSMDDGDPVSFTGLQIY